MRRLFALTGMGVVYAFLYAPIAVLILFSFNKAKYGQAWTGFTLDWYRALAGDSGLVGAAFNSLTVALISATAATILGTLCSVAMHNRRFAGRTALSAVLFVVMLWPDIVMGVSLLVLFIMMDMQLGFWTLFVSHVTFCLPFVIVTVSSRLRGFDKHMVEAAMDLGADELRAFTRIILPMAAPAVAAGWLLSFTLSMDDVIISFFVTGPTFEILPLKIYSMVKMGVKPTVNALCAVLVGVTVFLVITSQLLLREEKTQ